MKRLSGLDAEQVSSVSCSPSCWGVQRILLQFRSSHARSESIGWCGRPIWYALSLHWAYLTHLHTIAHSVCFAESLRRRNAYASWRFPQNLLTQRWCWVGSPKVATSFRVVYIRYFWQPCDCCLQFSNESFMRDWRSGTINRGISWSRGGHWRSCRWRDS